MKKIFALGTAAAVLSMTAIAANAAFTPVFTGDTTVAGETVTVDVVANAVTTNSTQFTVATTGLTFVSAEAAQGGMFGSTSMKYAWASAEAPAEGAVMLTLTYTVDAAAGEDVSVTLVADDGFTEVAADAVVSTVVDAAGEDVDDESPETSTVDTFETETDTGLVDEPTSEESATAPATVDAGEGDDGKGNPDTGIALAVVPAIVAGAAIVVAKKRK